jgi:tRNA-Thr(GGU) m(6)t(6)A37 methyltransferase TsaA
MEKFKLKQIGVIRTPYARSADAPIQGQFRLESRGEVEVFDEYAPGLQDLEGFSHITLLYYFHRATEERLTVKPYLDDVSRGVFATRAPWRPNRLGLTTVRLLERRDNVLAVAGVDMLDGTPLLDIKPYVAEFDIVRGPVRCGWLAGKIGLGERRTGSPEP